MLVLMRVSTYYQLINAINIKISLLKGQEVDLVLNQSSDFSEIGKKVEESGCFRKVFYSPDSLEENRAFRQLSRKEKAELSTRPQELVHDIGLTERYTDLYLPVDDEYNKLFYYYMVKKGNTPAVHIYEEGLASYTLDIEKRARTDVFRHSFYGSNAFLNNITELLLYEPGLYAAASKRIPLLQIPKINAEDNGAVQLFTGIFGQEEMPEEPIVFFMEGFHADRANTSDVELLDKFAEMFGKENIIVKMHPRDKEDWLSAKGYKIFPTSRIPWEILLLTNDVKRKLFVSLSSTAVVSAQVVFGKKASAMHLYAMMNIGGSQFLKQPVTKLYYEKLSQELNRDGIYFFRPKNSTELQESLFYLKARGRI